VGAGASRGPDGVKLTRWQRPGFISEAIAAVIIVSQLILNQYPDNVDAYRTRWVGCMLLFLVAIIAALAPRANGDEHDVERGDYQKLSTVPKKKKKKVRGNH